MGHQLDSRTHLDAAETVRKPLGQGFGLELVVLGQEPVPVLRFGVPDVFANPSDDYEQILDMYGLGVRDVFEAIRLRRCRT